jgi:hypothetical protein
MHCLNALFLSSTHTHLRAAGVGQHAAVLQDEERLGDAGFFAVGRAAILRPTPLQRLELHLAVDASKLPALLQHRLRGQT